MSPSQMVTWVVGARGLLGQHVVRVLNARGHEVLSWSVPWGDPESASAALSAGLGELRLVAGGRPWNIAWCAGAGVVASTAESLDLEGQSFSRFILDLTEVLAKEATGGKTSDGAFFLASSAGGLYAGSIDPPFSEATTPQPLSPYGHLKREMEVELTSLSRATGLPVLIARIANLYGPGQRMDKAQGLITQLCNAHYMREPISIYVSLDTIRDYLAVRDCAAMVGEGLDGLRDFTGRLGDSVVVKVFASGSGTTIAGVISECSRVLRRRPPVLLGSSTAAAQVRDLRLQSQLWPELDVHARTTLPTGIALTARDVEARIREAAT